MLYAEAKKKSFPGCIPERSSFSKQIRQKNQVVSSGICTESQVQEFFHGLSRTKNIFLKPLHHDASVVACAAYQPLIFFYVITKSLHRFIERATGQYKPRRTAGSDRNYERTFFIR